MTEKEIVESLIPSLTVIGTFVLAVWLPSYIHILRRNKSRNAVKDFASENMDALRERFPSEKDLSNYLNTNQLSEEKIYVVMTDRGIVPLFVMIAFSMISFSITSYKMIFAWALCVVVFGLLLRHETKYCMNMWYRILIFLLWATVLCYKLPWSSFL